MPRTANSEERREAVLAATWRVISRVGIENTTIREIAAEACCSTGALAHYFHNKDDILRQALERADAHVGERIRALPVDMPPRRALQATLLEALPLDEERALELTLDVNFWARALNQVRLRAMQHADHDKWREIVLERVARALPSRRSEEIHDIADVLIAFVDGLGLQALVYPELLSHERVSRLLDAQLRALDLAPESASESELGEARVPDAAQELERHRS